MRSIKVWGMMAALVCACLLGSRAAQAGAVYGPGGTIQYTLPAEKACVNSTFNTAGSTAVVSNGFNAALLCAIENNPDVDATNTAIPSPTLAMIVNQINNNSANNPTLAFDALVNLEARLGTPNLIRLAQATGTFQVVGIAQWLISWGDTNPALTQFIAQIGTAGPGGGGEQYAVRMIRSSWWQQLWMTPSQIYAEYILAGETTTGALAMASLPVVGSIDAGWRIGYGVTYDIPIIGPTNVGVGPAIVYVANKVDPNIMVAIGDAEGAAVNITAAWFYDIVANFSVPPQFQGGLVYGPWIAGINLDGGEASLPTGTVTVGPLEPIDPYP